MASEPAVWRRALSWNVVEYEFLVAACRNPLDRL